MPVGPTGSEPDWHQTPVLQRSCSHDQLVVLHRCHPDISPKITRVTTLGGFTTKAVVKTAIERLHELSAKKRAGKLITVRFGRANIEVKVVVHVAKTELNVSVEPSPLQSAPLCRVQRCTDVKRHNGIGNCNPRMIACLEEFRFILQESVNVVGVEFNRGFYPISGRTAKRVQFCSRHLQFRRRRRTRLDLSRRSCSKHADTAVHDKQTTADQNDAKNNYGDNKGQTPLGEAPHPTRHGRRRLHDWWSVHFAATTSAAQAALKEFSCARRTLARDHRTRKLKR